jgi:AcrR family transcriptional regulator
MARPRVQSITVATPSRLLDAALEHFSVRGIDGARLADIASSAGITRPSLLYHFPSKEQLYAATLERAFAALAEVIGGALGGPLDGVADGMVDGAADGEFRARLRSLVRGFVGFARAEPAICRLLLRSMVTDDDPGARAMLVDLASPLLGEVARFLGDEGHADVRPGVPVRSTLMGVIVGVLARAAADPAVRAGLWGVDDVDDADVWAVVEHALLSPQPTLTKDCA